MSLSTLEILKGARALIEDPDHWTRGWYGRDRDGNDTVDGNDPEAVCWCVWGACEKAGGASWRDNEAVREAQRALDALTEGEHAPTLNDALSTTHADILALYDRAIAAEEAK